MLNLKNKKIIIFGASGFIGEQTAVTLSKLGAKVILSGRDKEKLEYVYSNLSGDEHQILELDVTKSQSVQDGIKSCVERDNEKLFGMVYCTGIYPLRPLKNVTIEFLQEMMMVNYFGFVEAVKCFSHRKICSGGSIVALSSYASINGDKGQLVYSASKGAMDSSVVVMAKELMTKNIRVNTIRPASLLRKEIDLYSLPKGIIESIENMKTGPIRPENIAEQIAFLLDDSSSGVTGRCFDVRGYLS